MQISKLLEIIDMSCKYAFADISEWALDELADYLSSHSTPTARYTDLFSICPLSLHPFTALVRMVRQAHLSKRDDILRYAAQCIVEYMHLDEYFLLEALDLANEIGHPALVGPVFYGWLKLSPKQWTAHGMSSMQCATLLRGHYRLAEEWQALARVLGDFVLKCHGCSYTHSRRRGGTAQDSCRDAVGTRSYALELIGDVEVSKFGTFDVIGRLKFLRQLIDGNVRPTVYPALKVY